MVNDIFILETNFTKKMTQYSQQNKKNVFHVKKRTFWGELFQPCVANYTYTLNYINYIYCNN